jgi:hypothetical protein
MIDWDSYRDDNGFISGVKNPTGGSSGNAVLFAAEEKILRAKLKDWSADQQESLFRIISTECMLWRGLLFRLPPFRQDQEGLDDYIGAASIDPRLAQDILSWGREHRYRPFKWLSLSYYYCNTADETKLEAWFGRYPALIAHIQWAAGEVPPLWRRLWWFFSVAFSGSKDNQDPWILNWIMIETAGSRTCLNRLASAIYRWRLERAYVGLAHVFARYFNDANHPMVVACDQLQL